MIRRKVISSTIPISNPNYMSNMDGVLKDTIEKEYNNKLMSNYIILDAKVTGRGLSMPSLDRNVVANVDVVIDMDILVIPQYTILEKCIYTTSIADDNNMDQSYHIFTLQNDELPADVINRLTIIVQNNGLSADVIKRLDNLSQGDVIPLFVIKSAAYNASGKIGCMAIPNFDDTYSPIFKFTKPADSLGKIEVDKLYKISNKKIVPAPKNASISTIIDFLSHDQLVDYVTYLMNF